MSAVDGWWRPILAISTGASVGALLRWQLSERMNAWWPHLPAGTLLANLLGGYVVGLAMGWLAQHPGLSPEWRLALVTGFCGGLTTFSSFSAEVVALLQAGRLGWAFLTVATHLAGSLVATFVGLWTAGAAGAKFPA